MRSSTVKVTYKTEPLSGYVTVRFSNGVSASFEQAIADRLLIGKELTWKRGK